MHERVTLYVFASGGRSSSIDESQLQANVWFVTELYDTEQNSRPKQKIYATNRYPASPPVEETHAAQNNATPRCPSGWPR